jgi:hypothetical protein
MNALNGAKLATLEGREVVKGFLSKKQVSDFTGGVATGAVYGTGIGALEGRYYGDLLRDKSTGEILGMHGKGSFRGDPESTAVNNTCILHSCFLAFLT